MSIHRYRMSSTEQAEKLIWLLDVLRALHLDGGLRGWRPVGYAYARIVEIDHPSDMLPNRIVSKLDPLARQEPLSYET